MLKRYSLPNSVATQPARCTRRRSGKRSRLLAALILSSTWLAAMPVLAASPVAGMVIDNQATGSFVDSTDNSEKAIESNTVSVTVAEVAGITVTSANTPSAAPGGTANFDFTITNVGNDPTQFFIPNAPSAITGGTAGTLKIVAYDPDGSGPLAEIDLTASNITVAAGASTGTLLGAIAAANNGVIPVGGAIVVRVPVTVTAADGDPVSVTLGNTSGQPSNSNTPYVVGANGSGGQDVYTVDNADGVSGEAAGTPLNGDATTHRQEASATTSVTAVAANVTVSGTVFSDANGDVTINGSDAGTNAGSANLTVYALDPAGNVVDKATVAADGLYSLANIPQNTSVTLRLVNNSTVGIGATAPALPTLPNSWASTGERRNSTLDSGTTLGEIIFTTTTSNLTNYNFGIQQVPNFGLCPTAAYLTQGPNTNTIQLNSLDLNTAAITPISASIIPKGVNAIGLNRLNGYLYGMQPGNNRVVQVDANGVGHDLGAIPNVPLANNFIVGDVDANGVLYVMITSGSSIYAIDVNPASPTYLTLLNTISLTSTNILDFAFHPTNGKLYGVIGSNGHVVEITLPSGSGAATVIDRGQPTVLGTVGSSGYGAVYFANDGSLYAYRNGNAGTTNGVIYKITGVESTNAGLPVATILTATAAPISQNDGARCPLAPPPLRNVTVSGTVWDDANGNVILASPEAGTDAGSGTLTIYAVDSSGNVLASADVAANGTYSLLVPPNINGVTLRLSNDASKTVGQVAPVAASLPSGWVNTGESKNGTTETITPGDIAFDTATTDITNQNFGIEQLPSTTALNPASQTNPGGTTTVQVATLAGTDPEDGALGSNNTFQIVTLPTNATLTYNNLAVTAGQVISNYDPTLLKLDPTDDGPTTVSFTYAAVDAAGQADATPATVTMPFTGAPKLLLVKRITAINGGTAGRDLNGTAIDFTQFVNDSNTTDDNHVNWPGSYLTGAIDGGIIKNNDEVEYTIYFLSSGTSVAKNVRLCDRVPDQTTFVPTGFNSGSFAADPAGLPGADRGIVFSLGGSGVALSNVADGDRAQFFPAGVDPATVYPNINCGGANTNGAVVVNLGDVTNATGQGAPAASYGFIRFRAQAK
jgi:uncharacterized repeat protein (TIGR01451 family)